MEESKNCYFDVDVLFRRRKKGRKYSEKENIFFLEEEKNREGKGGKYLEKIFPKIVKDIEKSRSPDSCQFLDGFGIGFGKFGLGGKKSQFWFRKIRSQKTSIGFGSGNLVSEKVSRFRFRKIWSLKQSLSVGFGKFGPEKKVSVSISVKILVSFFSAINE